MILACADPRVIPEEVFGAAPGELFVVRVAGTVATKETVASLEYGAEVLGIPVLVVLGHQSAGREGPHGGHGDPRSQHRRSWSSRACTPYGTGCKEAKKEGLRRAVVEQGRRGQRAQLVRLRAGEQPLDVEPAQERQAPRGWAPCTPNRPARCIGWAR
jgi:hypothetical protein